MKKHRKYRLRPFGIAWWVTRIALGAIMVFGAFGWMMIMTELNYHL